MCKNSKGLTFMINKQFIKKQETASDDTWPKTNIQFDLNRASSISHF